MKTKNGDDCLPWDKLEWESKYSSLGSHSYCRNPGPAVHGGGDSEGPWCYIKTGWDYCDVRPCEDGCDKVNCKCGVEGTTTKNNRIVGGRDVRPGTYPWMAMVSRDRDSLHYNPKKLEFLWGDYQGG